MKKHFQYLRYVICHKWFVLVACLRCAWISGRPVLIWRGVIHDWQKFLPVEWTPYAWSFYGPWKYKERPQWLVDSFDRAWLHHQHYGPHHWQYWVLREDSGKIKTLKMPSNYVYEMIADWSGAGMAIHGNPDPFDWYFKNQTKMALHPDTRRDVEMLLHGHLFGGTYDIKLAVD